MGPAALDGQAPCTLETSKRQPSQGAAEMLVTPPSSPMSGHMASFVPGWELSPKMRQWQPACDAYQYGEPLQHPFSIQLCRPELPSLCNLQTSYSEPPALHAAEGEQVVPQRMQDMPTEAAADWVAPPVMPRAVRSPVREQVAAPSQFRPLLPVRHRIPVIQAAVDHHLAPSSPSPVEQGRVLPELGMHLHSTPEAPSQPAPAAQAHSKQQPAGFSWLSKKDVQQPLSSLESVGTPLGRCSPAPEVAAPVSAGQQAESAHDVAHQLQYVTEPELPPKKRKLAREMTPPLISHQWQPHSAAKPAFTPAGSPAAHKADWDTVVPKKQRHRGPDGDSSSSSSAAAFEHRPLAGVPRRHAHGLRAHPEVVSAPQKEHSDPLCMLLDAAEELSHHEDHVVSPITKAEYYSAEPRSLAEAWAAGDMAVYPYAKSLATKTSISGLVIQKEWVHSLMEPNEHKNNTAVSAITDSGQAWPITFYLNKDRRELRGPPDGQPGGWAALRRALNAQPSDVAVLWKEYGQAHRTFRVSVLPKAMVPQGIHLAP